MKIKEVLNDNQKKLALAQVLNISIPNLIINKEKELTKQEEKAYKKIEKKLNKNIPIQQALKKAYFYNREFYINKNVLKGGIIILSGILSSKQVEVKDAYIAAGFIHVYTETQGEWCCEECENLLERFAPAGVDEQEKANQRT